MTGWTYFHKVTEFTQKKKKESEIIKKRAEYIGDCDTEHGKIKDAVHLETIEYMLGLLIREIQEMRNNEK